MRTYFMEEGQAMKIFVSTPNGTEAILDGDCDDITSVIPPERQALMIERCKDPFFICPDEAEENFFLREMPRGVILPPAIKNPPLVRIPTPLPGKKERLTERPSK